MYINIMNVLHVLQKIEENLSMLKRELEYM